MHTVWTKIYITTTKNNTKA